MKSIQDRTGSAKFLNDHIVLVQMNEGTEVNREIALQGNKAIANAMPGDYGMIIDRQADYSLMPVEVFEVLNSISTLKAIAIVAHRQSTAEFIKFEKRMFKNSLELFVDIESAEAWIEQTLSQQQYYN